MLKGLFRKTYIMRTINLVAKACIKLADYETTLAITVLENKAETDRNIVTIRFLITISAQCPRL